MRPKTERCLLDSGSRTDYIEAGLRYGMSLVVYCTKHRLFHLVFSVSEIPLYI